MAKKLLSVSVILLALVCCQLGLTGQELYHTPLAGEEFETIFWGKHIKIPARDRTEVLALSVGSSFYIPEIGNQPAVPFAALYYHKYWEEEKRNLRAVMVGVVNTIDFADGSWNDKGWEMLLHWENFTIPFPRAEIIEEEEIEESEIYWGQLRGGVGLGWRMPVYPYHYDNDLRVQLFYQPGYLYIRRSSKTGDDVILPPNTVVHQLHLLFRYDAFDRNLLELPHRGWASGIDITLGRREHWADHQFGPGVTFTRHNTRDYLRLTAYAVAAFDLPFLSERHRLLMYAHGGWSRKKNWDRFSAFRLGGGPFSSEAGDLQRHPFPGALFDQFIVESYFLLTLEYRVEVFFFLFLHLRGTLGWGRVATLDANANLLVTSMVGEAFSIGITTGFFLHSMFYLEYAYDNRVIRYSDSGHGFLVVWSKQF